MKTKINDLNEHLFAQLERLNDETLSPEAIKIEIEKSKVMANIASNIINSGRLVLEAVELKSKIQGDDFGSNKRIENIIG